MDREGEEAIVIGADRTEFYDLRADPEMRNDLAPRRPERVAALHARALEHFGREQAGSAKSVRIDAETSERLRSLGYVAD